MTDNNTMASERPSLTDEQLRDMIENDSNARVVQLSTEILALRAERAKPTPSDVELARSLAIAILTDCAMRYIEGPQSQVDRAIDLGTRTVLPLIASIRAEGSAERAKLEAEILAQREYWTDQYCRWRRERAYLAQPAESGAAETCVCGVAGCFAHPSVF